MPTFIPYIGGKHFLVKSLLPLIPVHSTYVEVFGGGASLLLNKPRSTIEVLNDIDGDLVNLWLVARDHSRELVAKLETLPYSRELNKRWTEDVRHGKVPRDPIERAARYYFVLRSTFAAYFGHGWSFGLKDSHPKRFRNAINNIAKVNERLQTVYIDHMDFRRCIRNWDRPTTFFFLDPPYIGVSGYKFNFTERDHADLRWLLGKIQGKFLLTYNDCQQVRELYKGFGSLIIRAQLAAKKTMDRPRERMAHKIIMNYDPPVAKQPMKMFKSFEQVSLFES